jgi:hypothetical protein
MSAEPTRPAAPGAASTAPSGARTCCPGGQSLAPLRCGLRRSGPPMIYCTVRRSAHLHTARLSRSPLVSRDRAESHCHHSVSTIMASEGAVGQSVASDRTQDLQVSPTGKPTADRATALPPGWPSRCCAAWRFPRDHESGSVPRPWPSVPSSVDAVAANSPDAGKGQD